MPEPNNIEMARVEVTAGHSSWAYIYNLFKPTIAIDGRRHRLPWGTHSFDVPPGVHQVEVSYPWLFSRECGKAAVQISLGPKETKRVTYRAGMIRYLPGKITVE